MKPKTSTSTFYFLFHISVVQYVGLLLFSRTEEKCAPCYVYVDLLKMDIHKIISFQRFQESKGGKLVKFAMWHLKFVRIDWNLKMFCLLLHTETFFK